MKKEFSSITIEFKESELGFLLDFAVLGVEKEIDAIIKKEGTHRFIDRHYKNDYLNKEIIRLLDKLKDFLPENFYNKLGSIRCYLEEYIESKIRGEKDE